MKLFILLEVFFIWATFVESSGNCSGSTSDPSSDAGKCISKSTEEDSHDTLDDDMETSDNGRIPPFLHPLHYKIRLQPFINGNLSIFGRLELTFTIAHPTNKIILNMVDIITRNETCTVTPFNKQTAEEPIIVTNQTYEGYFQHYIIHLNRNLTSGITYTLSVDFIGYLNSKLVGFYLSTYKDETGVVRRLASTQFSPTDARKAFPCLDEPVFKATFNIILVRQTNMTAWSNMPIIRTIELTNSPAWVEDHFDITPRMSTYLIGFLISDFKRQESTILNNTKFSVLTREAALYQTEYAAEFGPKILAFLEDYFQIPFPLPKLDMAAIPDFKFNGMENWGLIMYRETAMLFDAEKTTVGGKRKIAAVVSHEIAHQWFGNLVTPEWWSDLWLKEGFANFMGFLATDSVEPSWKMMDHLVYEAMYSALQLDSFHSSHPINVEVDHPDRISEIFDSISYNKGASIIRMMYHFLTEEYYKQGMTTYLETLKYDNANQEQLWGFLTEAWQGNDSPEISVKEVMDTWTLQQGYPVIKVSRNGNEVSLSQEPFIMEREMLDNNNTDANCTVLNDDCTKTEATWWVPISYTDKSTPNFTKTEPSLWMHPSDTQIQFNTSLEDDEWILVNLQRTGFYRVNYDQKNWELLIHQLKENASVIHPLNRAQLLDDSFNLARAGMLPYSLCLNMSSYMTCETELAPWKLFLYNFKYIYKQAKFSENNEMELIKPFFLNLVIPLYNITGLEDKPEDDYEMQTLRAEASRWACELGYEPCVSHAKRFFDQWLENPHQNSLASLRKVIPVILCTGILEGTEETWNKTFNWYLESNLQTEKVDILNALGCSNNSVIIKRFLSMALDENSDVKKQDSAKIFQAVSSSREGRHLAWEVIKHQWRFMVEFFGSGSYSLWRVLAAPTLTFGSEKLLQELHQFQIDQKDHIGSAKQTLERSLEGAILNNAWRNLSFPDVMKWLSLLNLRKFTFNNSCLNIEVYLI